MSLVGIGLSWTRYGGYCQSACTGDFDVRFLNSVVDQWHLP